MPDRDDRSTAFTDFSDYFERLVDRAWITKEILLASLELAEEARRHRNELWKINSRLMQKFGEAIDDVTAEFSRRTP